MGVTFYAYACDIDCHILGSDGTVSFWDKDARTRMKSKPSPVISFPPLDPFFSLCSSPHFGVCPRSLFICHSSPIHSVPPLTVVYLLNQSLEPFLPCIHTCTHTPDSPAFNAVPSPIVSASFNHTGTIFAYASTYDWSKGHEGSVPSQWNKVLLHGCKEDEVKKRPLKPGMGNK